MWITIVVLKERKVLTQSSKYKEIDKPGGKATEVHYAVTPQALSVTDKNDSKAAPQYDYASTGTISVSEKLSSRSPVITVCMYIHYMYVHMYVYCSYVVQLYLAIYIYCTYSEVCLS